MSYSESKSININSLMKYYNKYVKNPIYKAGYSENRRAIIRELLRKNLKMKVKLNEQVSTVTEILHINQVFDKYYKLFTDLNHPKF